MKFFKTDRPLTAEDETALARLSALANRTKFPRTDGAEQSLITGDLPAPDPLELRDVLQ